MGGGRLAVGGGWRWAVVLKGYPYQKNEFLRIAVLRVHGHTASTLTTVPLGPGKGEGKQKGNGKGSEGGIDQHLCPNVIRTRDTAGGPMHTTSRPSPSTAAHRTRKSCACGPHSRCR